MNETIKKPKSAILVAMSGKRASTVAAYLMKKQGHRVIGVTVQWFDQEDQRKIFKPWSIEDLTPIKAICDELDIEFYGIHGGEVFQAYVEEGLIAARLAGEVFDFQLALHTALFRLLKEKAEVLKADRICTGHLAKITINQSTGRYNVVTAPELEFDQSYLLSRLGNTELSMLELPLSEMKVAQVNKLAEHFASEFRDEEKKLKRPSNHEVILDRYIRARAPASLIKTGQFYLPAEEAALGEHEGHHLIELGSNQLHDREDHLLDSHLLATSINSRTGQILLEDDHFLEFEYIYLHQLFFAEGTDFSRPFEVHALTPRGQGKLPGLFMPKNHSYGVLKLQAPQKGFLARGHSVFLYNKSGPNGKLLARASVLEAGLLHEGQLHYHKVELEIDESLLDEDTLRELERVRELHKTRGARF
jgi:tRNA U34 2-thiouridine synthase MnmA/TrmU